MKHHTPHISHFSQLGALIKAQPTDSSKAVASEHQSTNQSSDHPGEAMEANIENLQSTPSSTDVDRQSK
jgi:hypothetical protein